ncbi:MAG: V-type ATP synthase subunit I [Methanobrevibacter wolinii]|nr:V-type ATP synthase subunit I [Methanobrevibacter wolinii]
MFQTERMRKLKIITLDDYVTPVIRDLHEAGLVQIEDISDRIQQNPEVAELITPSKATSKTGKVSSLLMRTTGLSDLFGEALSYGDTIKDKLHDMFNPDVPVRKPVEKVDVDALCKYAESVLEEVDVDVVPVQEKLSALDNESSKLISKITVAKKLTNVNYNLEILEDTKTTSTIVGRIDVESASELKAELSKITDEIIIDDIHSDETFDSIIIVVANEYHNEVYSSLRRFNFENLDVSEMEGTPSEFINNANARLDAIDNERHQTKVELKSIAEKWDDDVLSLKEQLENEKERNEILSSFGETEKSKVFEAWVPLKKVDETKQIIEASSDGYCVIEVEDVPDDSEDVPVLQNHKGYFKPFELLVQMYSPLKYNEIDPTFFVAITFPFFFGFCLTDGFYGFLDFLIGYFLLYRGLGRNSQNAKDFGIIVMASGIWAIILGLITNAFLGDFWDRILGLGPLPTCIPWLDSFKNSATILIIAIAVGIIYTNIAFILGAINNVRNGNTKDALTNQIVWFVLEVGILFLAIGYMIPSIGMIGYVIGAIFIIVAFGLLFWGGGVYGIMDLFGFMGDILSYARLLALCLATGGVAMTVNILTVMLNTMVPFVGIILAIIVFVLGHLVNCAFQTLGAGVNALRLNYVEFFGQFYIGGKHKFEAFKASRKFTKFND